MVDYNPAEKEIWDCDGCSARAPPRFFEIVEGRDDAMRCPDCDGLAYKMAGSFSL